MLRLHPAHTNCSLLYSHFPITARTRRRRWPIPHEYRRARTVLSSIPGRKPERVDSPSRAHHLPHLLTLHPPQEFPPVQTDPQARKHAEFPFFAPCPHDPITVSSLGRIAMHGCKIPKPPPWLLAMRLCSLFSTETLSYPPEFNFLILIYPELARAAES